MHARILSYILPPRCLVCGKNADALLSGVCGGCSDRIRPVPRPVCAVCGDPSGTEGVCLRCQADPPPYDVLRSAYIFAGPLKDIVHAFKYADATYYKRFLAQALFDVVRQESLRADLIAFVPMHWTRMILRGYNQAALMAKGLSGLTGIPVRYDVLKKTRRTAPQVGLRKTERRRNIHGAFVAKGVEGKHVLVVDDVVTTGQTAREVSESLKRSGARRVSFISAGRMVA